MAEQLGNIRRRRRLLAASEVDGGEDGAAGEDAEGPVLEEGRDGSGDAVDRGGPSAPEVEEIVGVDRNREGSAPMVVHLVHVRASLRDEPLNELEREQEEGRVEGRSAEEGRCARRLE